MNIYVMGLMWVAGAALLAAASTYLIRRAGTVEGTVENNEAAGQVFTLVGGLQAVLIAFVLISLFDGAAAAEDGSYREADAVVAAVWAAEVFPGDTHTEIADQARAYADTVINSEWPRMQQGSEVGDEGWQELSQLRTLVAAAPTADEWSIDQKNEASEQLWNAYQARQDRLNTAADGGVNAVVWFALVAGTIMSLALPLLFGGPRPATHIVIVATLAATMTLLLFATYQLQNPYGGSADVDPTAFVAALDRLR
ncbi:bestrophin-like domain [Actinophytocola sediminis]